jgi:glycogen debranching enzyme
MEGQTHPPDGAADPLPSSHVGPSGQAFDVVERAGPVQVVGAPDVPAEARADLLVLKCDGIVLCARPDGDVHRHRVSGEGLYARDTRHLSRLRVSLGGVAPVPLTNALASGHSAIVEATNPTLVLADDDLVLQETISVRRRIVVADRLEYEIRVRSYVDRPLRLDLAVELDADFADVFEVRTAARREARGLVLAPILDPHCIVFAYVGVDGMHLETRVSADPAPGGVTRDAGGVTATWPLDLPPRGAATVLLHLEAFAGDVPPPAPRRPADPEACGRALAELALDDAEAAADAKCVRWRDRCTTIATDDEFLDRLMAASLRDLHALMTTVPGGRLPAAGIPWYVAAFGRDSIWTSEMSLMVEPGVARGTLEVLAHLQAREDEPWRDAEPGKILHELRLGELARAGIIPHTPYYGTVDATPLFVALAASYHRWTGDLGTLAALRPALDAALTWIDEHGDLDGDGFLEYDRRSPGGLVNQGWKDSHDCIVHADGHLAEGPIALVEVQAYVYLAKTGIAPVYEALGDPARAAALRGEAAELRRRFNEAFWNPAEGTYVLALDGRKRQVRSVTSNAAHALYAGIADDDKAAAVAERLMAPDMFSGWGVRTLAATSPAYNPMSYHNGSVWPHDNAIAAAGLKRYGHTEGALRITRAMIDVAAGARDARLPELFCGFTRHEVPVPVAYPVACIPQAWAAVTPFYLIQSLLGLQADAQAGALHVGRPVLPAGVQHVRLDGLRVGDGDVSLAFRGEDGVTGFSLLRQRGDVRVSMSP